MPRQLGLARLAPPTPLSSWSKLAEAEKSPEELEHYRAHYNWQTRSALGRRGDYCYTAQLHVRRGYVGRRAGRTVQAADLLAPKLVQGRRWRGEDAVEAGPPSDIN